MLSPAMLAELWEFMPADGNYPPWRARRAAICAEIEALTPETAAPYARDLAALILRNTDHLVMLSAAATYVPYCLARGEHASLVRIIERTAYAGGLFGALATAAKLGKDVWPVLEPLVRHRDLTSLSEALGACLASARLSDLEPLFRKLIAASAWVAAGIAENIADTPQRFCEIANAVVTLARGSDENVRLRALRSLRRAGQNGATLGDLLSPLARDLTPGPECAERAAVLARDRLNCALRGDPTVDLDDDLSDPRASVRLGFVQALAPLLSTQRALWPYLLAAAIDDDASVRVAAHATVRDFAVADPAFAPSEDTVRGWLSPAHAAAHDDVRDLVTFLARRLQGGLTRWLTPGPTRACAQCNDVKRHETWENNHSAPKAFAKLETVDAALRRCTACQAYFSYSCDVDYDIIANETHTLVRLTRKQALTHAAIDTTHPRFVEWPAALIADLHDPEPSVRTAAAAELSLDACAEGAVAWIEGTLLNHPRVEVVREALRRLQDRFRLAHCPVSRTTLAALCAHADAHVQRSAAALLTVNDALAGIGDIWRLREGIPGEGQIDALRCALDANLISAPVTTLDLATAALAQKPTDPWNFFYAAAGIIYTASDRAAVATLVANTLDSPHPWQRESATQLFGAMPADLKKDPTILGRVLAATALRTSERAALAADQIVRGAPLAPAVPLFIEALPADDRYETIVKAINAAFARGEVDDALFIPLCAHCELTRNAYTAMGLVHAWAATRDVPQDALPLLITIVEEGQGSFHDDAVRALTSIYMRTRNEEGLRSLRSFES